MKRLLLAAALVSGVGCMQVQPVGVMARLVGPPKGAPLPTGKDGDAAPAGPVSVRPAPPAELITPDRVSADNPADAAQRLLTEYEADWKSMPAASRTAEVSRIKGGVKVQ